MPAAPPGTVTLSAVGTDGTEVEVTLHFDPATGDLSDPAITTAGATQANLTLTCSDDTTIYQWSVPPGSTIAAADLASLTDADGIPITNRDQFSLGLSAS